MFQLCACCLFHIHYIIICVFVCSLFVVLYGITPRGGLWKTYYLFLIVYDVEGVIVSRACTITYNYKHIRYMECKGKSRRRLSVIVLYHVSVFASVHIHYADKTYKEDTQEAYL